MQIPGPGLACHEKERVPTTVSYVIREKEMIYCRENQKCFTGIFLLISRTKFERPLCKRRLFTIEHNRANLKCRLSVNLLPNDDGNLFLSLRFTSTRMLPQRATRQLQLKSVCGESTAPASDHCPRLLLPSSRLRPPSGTIAAKVCCVKSLPPPQRANLSQILLHRPVLILMQGKTY
jgi:hypothetical protein